MPARARSAARIRVLVLGGTGDARELAARCTAGQHVETVSSLAGLLTTTPETDGDLRHGGFGGAEGLADYLRTGAIDAVVDATHPFAATITAAAVVATAATGLPLLVLRRPGWTERPGDDWRRVPSLAVAADRLPAVGERVLLATGRRSLAAFAGVSACWFLARCIEPPAPPLPPRLQVLLDRGPFSADGERALFDRYRIDVLVTRDSGAAAVAAKLVVARERGVPVVMVDRPPLPAGTHAVDSVDAAYARLLRLSRAARGAAGTCP